MPEFIRAISECFRIFVFPVHVTSLEQVFITLIQDSCCQRTCRKLFQLDLYSYPQGFIRWSCCQLVSREQLVLSVGLVNQPKVHNCSDTTLMLVLGTSSSNECYYEKILREQALSFLRVHKMEHLFVNMKQDSAQLMNSYTTFMCSELQPDECCLLLKQNNKQ